MLPAFQGRGVATAATCLALDHARASDGPRTVHAFPVPENGPSNAICRKLGFTFRGEVEIEFPKGCFAPSNDWSLDLDTAKPDGRPRTAARHPSRRQRSSASYGSRLPDFASPRLTM